MSTRVWPEYVRYFGPLELFHGPKATIVNSRQSKTPSGDDPWVQNTLKAVKAAGDASYTIVTSVGMITWELVLYAAAKEKLPVVVVIPFQDSEPEEDEILKLRDEFGLDAQRTGILSYHGRNIRSAKKEELPLRDRYVLSMANCLIPVSVRTGGNMAKLLDRLGSDLRKIDRRFETEYDPQPHHGFPEPKKWKLNPELKKMDWPLITHFARSVHGPWRDETAKEFYRDLTKSKAEYPRNGLATLKQILKSGRLLATGEHLRDDVEAVSFTELHPAESPKLMTWRKNKVSWNFEPYGIALDRTWAEKHGIRPVKYGTDKDYRKMSKSERPFFQNKGEKGDWRPEREWRLIGDLDLKKVPATKLRIVVRTPKEAKSLSRVTKAKVIAMCAE